MGKVRIGTNIKKTSIVIDDKGNILKEVKEQSLQEKINSKIRVIKPEIKTEPKKEEKQ